MTEGGLAALRGFCKDAVNAHSARKVSMDITKLEEMPTYQITDGFVRFVRGGLKLETQDSGPLIIELLNRMGFEATRIESDGDAVKVTQSRNSERATKWLANAWKKVVDCVDLQEAFTFMQRFMEDTRPLNPILLTEFDEHLIGIEPEDPCGRQPRDEDPLPTECVGIHEFCGGTFNSHEISANHFAIVCDKCQLRISISKKYKTYAGLRGRSNKIVAKR
jgi:hypothetical protein